MAGQGKLSPERIAEIRHRAGLSQKEFAETFGVNRATVAKWEIGRRVPNEWHNHALRKFEEELNEAERRQQTREFVAGIAGAVAVGGVGYLMAKLYSEATNDSNESDEEESG